MAHALGGLVAGAAEGGVIGQDVEAAQQVVAQQPALDHVIRHAAHKAHLREAVEGHSARLDAVAAHRHVGTDQVQRVDVEAQLLRGKGVPAQQPALEGQHRVGERVMHILRAEAGRRAEAEGEASLGARRDHQLRVGAVRHLPAVWNHLPAIVRHLDDSAILQGALHRRPEGVVQQGEAKAEGAIPPVQRRDGERLGAGEFMHQAGQVGVGGVEPGVEGALQRAVGCHRKRGIGSGDEGKIDGVRHGSTFKLDL